MDNKNISHVVIIVKHRIRLDRKALNTLSSEVFKNRLGKYQKC